MAYLSLKDLTAFTYNSNDLKAFLAGGFEISDDGVIDEWRAAGSAYKSRKHTGQYDCPPFEIGFKYDGTATGPAVTCAQDTSATLLVTLGTGISVTGTCVVQKWRLGAPEEGLYMLYVTFAPDGTMTWDLAE